LIGKLLARLAGERAGEVTFHRAAMRALFEHDWPRNVRELEHTLGVALALAEQSEISAKDVEESVRRSSRTSEAPGSGRPSEPDGAASSMSDEEIERRLLELMERHAGNVSAVARDMGKARAQIRRWFKRFHIDAERFR
jgi:DNA-binding NtrC family response regulator